MSLNRVTPSPDEERYPLENMEQGYSGTQQNKDEVIIGDDDQSADGDLLAKELNDVGKNEPLPMEPAQEDTRIQITAEDELQVQGSRTSLDDFNAVDGRELYTPRLPKAERLEETRYSPPLSPKAKEDKEETSPRRLPPVLNSQQQESFDQSEKSNNDNGDFKTALPPISGSGNKVAPADEDMILRSELRQRSAGSHGHSGSKKTFHGHYQGMGEKGDLIIGAEDNTEGAGCCGWLLYVFSILLIAITLPFSLVLTIKVVQEYERAVIFRLGRLPQGGAKGPGIFFIIPCIESYTKVDLRTVSFDVPPQEVLTKDSVTVSVDAVVYYRVSNPTISVANVENAHHSTRLLAQTTLRNILGTKNMSEILSDRESISQGMQSTLDEATDRWGIKVERVEIKDVRLPIQLQRAMAAEAEAAREARAKVIAAEGEHKASRSLKEAADVMAQSGAALQLRYLQTLNTISAEKNSTIIFPLPIDMLKTFMNKGR